MTNEAKRCVVALRTKCREEGSCDACGKKYWCYLNGDDELSDHAADLIESLSAELEQVKRERDAAVEDFTEAMKYSEGCIFCKHLNVIDDDGGCDMPKILPGESCWQWRGVKEENEC